MLFCWFEDTTPLEIGVFDMRSMPTVLMTGGHAGLGLVGQNGNAISGGRRYATSKLCVIMYAYELDRRLRQAQTQVDSIAYDPGFLPDTGMGLGAPAIFRSSMVKFLLHKLGMTMGQMPLSGEALAMIDQDSAYANSSGKYFHSKDGVLRETRSSLLR